MVLNFKSVVPIKSSFIIGKKHSALHFCEKLSFGSFRKLLFSPVPLCKLDIYLSMSVRPSGVRPSVRPSVHLSFKYVNQNSQNDRNSILKVSYEAI